MFGEPPLPQKQEPQTMHREEIGNYILEERSVAGGTYGEYRFSVDRKVREQDGTIRLVNVGWYKTRRGARNAISMERSARMEDRSVHGGWPDVE